MLLLAPFGRSAAIIIIFIIISIIINLHPVGETTWGRMTNSYTVSTV